MTGWLRNSGMRLRLQRFARSAAIRSASPSKFIREPSTMDLTSKRSLSSSLNFRAATRDRAAALDCPNKENSLRASTSFLLRLAVSLSLYSSYDAQF
jgi:hypothetical protein